MKVILVFIASPRLKGWRHESAFLSNFPAKALIVSLNSRPKAVSDMASNLLGYLNSELTICPTEIMLPCKDAI
jgi:hypothetical protein